MSIRFTLFALTTLTAALVIPSTDTMADELLSKVSMKVVFASKSTPDASSDGARIPSAIVSGIESALQLKSPAAPAPIKKAVSVDRLLGRWTAKTDGGDVFAMELKTKNQFALVHLSGGQSTVSRGSFLLVSDRLTLKSNANQSGVEAVTLLGQLKWTGKDRFIFTLGRTEILFRRQLADGK